MVDARRSSGSRSDCCSAIVSGSRKSRRLCASATTIAYLPSGVKYMLYGSSTGIGGPGLPVLGSIGVRLPLFRRSRVVRDPQRLQVPRRHDVLRVDADREAVDHLQASPDRSRRRRWIAGSGRRRAACSGRRRAQLVGGGLAVEVGRVEDGRHARHGLHRRAGIGANLAQQPGPGARRALRRALRSRAAALLLAGDEGKAEPPTQPHSAITGLSHRVHAKPTARCRHTNLRVEFSGGRSLS